MDDDICTTCGERHTRMYEADETDPRLIPWMELLEASGEHRDGNHLLIIALRNGEHRSEKLITGMDDPVKQVELMGQIITTIMAEAGDRNGARTVGNTITKWLETISRLRQDMQNQQN